MGLRFRSTAGGSVQLDAPAGVTSDVVLEVPALAGAKLLTDKSPGTVLQVVQAKIAAPAGNSGGWFTTTSTTPVNSGLSVAITPKFATSKLLVEVKGNLNLVGTPAVGAQFWVYRDGANIHSGGNANAATFLYGNAESDRYLTHGSTNLINANNTNLTTFALYVACWNSNSTMRLGGHDGQTSITVMEIAA